VAELGGQVRTSPVVGADATVYVGSTDRKVYAVLAGRVVWQAPVGSFEDHSLELMPDGSVRLAIPSQGRPQAFELARISAAGEILPNRVPRLTSRFSAESAEGRTFFAEGSELRQLGDGSWKVDAGAPISTFPVIDRRGRVCAGTSAGTLICADRYGRVLWSYRAQAPITASPAAGPDGDILFGCADRRLYCVRDGALRWQFPTGGAIYSAPVVDASGTAYFGSNDGSLYAVNESGDRIWSLPLGNEIHGSPAFDSSGSLYVGTLARKLFCISDSSRISRKSGLQIQ
jgi:outer membrane protein assembly factor BamB